MSNKLKQFISKRQTSLVRYGKYSHSFKFWRNKVQAEIRSRKESYYKNKVHNMKDIMYLNGGKKLKNFYQNGMVWATINGWGNRYNRAANFRPFPWDSKKKEVFAMLDKICILETSKTSCQVHATWRRWHHAGENNLLFKTDEKS
jgi:hypothetical protein